MKKVLSILFVLSLLLSMAALTASAADAEYIAYANGDPNWKAVYVPVGSYNVESVADCAWDGVNYNAILPGDLHTSERLYINQGDPTHIVSTRDGYDIGLQFTAPQDGSYQIEFAGAQKAEGSDGVIVRLYDSSMTQKAETVAGYEGGSFCESFSLTAGQKLYVFFNMGEHPWSDYMQISTLKVSYSAPALSEAVFTPKDTSEVKVSNGAQYNQWFDVANDPNLIGLWTGFYVTKGNAIGYLVPDTSAGHTLKLPAELRGGDNQWMVMWEGLGNATSPIGEYTIGDYFTAPASGTVTVNATFAYNTPAEAGDGIYVTVYKNKIADENVIIAKTLFDNASSAQANTDNKGLSIKAEGVEVKKGDVIIFVYDKNAHYYSDNLTILGKNVTYTAVTNPDHIFSPDNTKVVANGQEISALKSLTVQQVIEALGADAVNAAAYKADGVQIMDTANTSAEELASLVFFNDVNACCPIGVYSVCAVDILPGQEPIPDPTGDAILLQVVAALLSVSGLAVLGIKGKKK